MLQDSEGIFWMATTSGLTRYDEKAEYSNRFKQFRNNPKIKSSIATNRLTCLYDWDSTYLVAGAEQYPAIFINKKTFEITYWVFNEKTFRPDKGSPLPKGEQNWIHDFEEHNGQLYFSILTNGKLFRVDKRTGRMESMRNTESIASSIPDFFLATGKMWMAGWNPGLYVQDNNPTAALQRISGIDEMVNCVVDYNQLYLLAGGRGSGLYRVNKTNGKITQYKRKIGYPGSLPSNKVNCLFKDSRGIVWVGTAAGLAKYDEKAWLFSEAEFVDPQTDVTINRTYRFDDGSVAVNTSRGMFLSDAYQYQFEHIKFINRDREIVPDCIYKLPDSTFLMGSESGFYAWEKGSDRLKELEVKFGANDFYDTEVYEVTDFVPDVVNGNHGYWMAVIGDGVAFYSTDDKKIYSFITNKNNPKSLGNNLVLQIMLDKKGNLWVATLGGLWMRKKNTPLTDETFTGFVNEPGNKATIPGNEIMGIWCDLINRIWFTVRGRGLCMYDNGKFKLYTPENTASSTAFMGLHADHRNRLWILTRNGLEVFDLIHKKFYHVDVNDGNANTLLYGRFSNETNGAVSFAAGNTVYTFRPDVMSFATNYPEVYLVAMNVLGKDYLYKAKQGLVKLKSSERFINFSVSAQQFNAPKTVRFQYRLEGVEDEWNDSEDGEIKYTSLPWGKFKLLVRVTNPSGQYGGEKVLAEFRIATPFYYTWWFLLLVALVIAAATYALYRYRIRQLMKLQSMRNKIARDLHDDIGSTLGSISFLSEAAKQQLQQSNPAGAEKLLGKIGENSREMVENMSDIVWSVNPKNDTAHYLIERMRVFAADLVAASPIQLHFNFDAEAEHVKLTMEQRKNLFLIFKETVYNSVKYADCRNIYIDIKRTGTGIALLMKDDGKGFDVNNYKSKNGNGIKNMRTRAEEVKAIFQIESSPTGTVTKLTAES